MSKLDDKLRNLKNDIPCVSKDFDDKVMNAMLNTPPKPRFTWRKLGIISSALVPALTLTLVIILTNLPKEEFQTPNLNTSQTTDLAASEETMAPGQTEDAIGEGFKYKKTNVINGIDIVNDNAEDYYTHFDLTYATTASELVTEVNKYHAVYQELLEGSINELKVNDTHFAEYNVAIVPFMFSSSEVNIRLDRVNEDGALKKTEFVFTLASPTENDADLRVTFFVVSLKKANYDINTNNNLSISVINTLNNEAHSVYYNN